MPSDKLFQPNNHSPWEVVWVDAAEDQAAEVCELLETHYGWQALDSVKKVGAWEVRSHNFRVEVLDAATRRTILVKKNILWRDEDRITLLERVLGFLSGKAIPVPVIIPTHNQLMHVVLNGHIWQVFEFIHGNYFCGTPDELSEAAKHFARLHVVLQTIPYAEEIGKLTKRVKMWTSADFQQHFEYATTHTSQTLQAFLSQRVFIEEAIADVLRHSDLPQRARCQVARNSLHPHDTLFENGHLQAIIDFEEIGVNELARDIGNACHRFVRQYVVHQGRPWSETLSTGVRIFLSAYLEQNQLPREELELMPVFIKDELLRKLHSSLIKLQSTEEQSVYEKEAIKFIDLLQEAVEIGKEILAFASST